MFTRAKVILALLLLACVTTPLLGQVTTGRHRPAIKAPDEPSNETTAKECCWFFTAGIGVLASGNLFQVDSKSVPWHVRAPSGSTFYSDNFVVMLDENVDLAMALGRRLSERAWIRMNLSTAHINMHARARVGQGAGFFQWDRMSIVLLGLDVEYRLVGHPRYPYLLAGGGGVAVRGSKDTSIDQTRLALRFGGGYHIQINKILGLRSEIRNSLVFLDVSQYQPTVAYGEQPDVSIIEKTPHHFWEFLLLLHGTF